MLEYFDFLNIRDFAHFRKADSHIFKDSSYLAHCILCEYQKCIQLENSPKSLECEIFEPLCMSKKMSLFVTFMKAVSIPETF